MAPRFIIRFYSHAEDQIDWLLVGADGLVSSSGQGFLANIPKLPESCSVIILVPSVEVLSFQVALPKMKASKLRKMVPFAIEEYLVADLSELHFAISNFHSNGKLSVAVVQHEQMKMWLQKLKEADIHPDAMLPDFWYFPRTENGWTIWIESDFAWVQTGENQGFFSDLQNLKILMDLKIKEFEQEGKSLPEKIELIFSAGPCQENLINDIKNNFNIQLDIKISSSPLLNIVSEYIPEKQTFNLLQPPYEVKRKWGKLKKQWFPIALLFGIWLSLFFLKEIFEYFYLKRQNAQLEQQTLSLYQQVFPSAKDTRAYKQELQQLLERTLKVARGDPFFLRLSQVTPLIKTSGVLLTGFDYRDQVLTLKVSAQDFQTLNGLLQIFKQKGILVDQRHTGQQQNAVVAEWVIRK